ncbi:MAG: hypothetical protein IKL77_04015, partial [Clostridia bacterium]|nr:hypothetical protein [Clostridia bacterium]
RSYINDGGSNNKFNVNDISIRMTNGENQTGIYAENGRVNVTANTAKLISIEGNSGKGIHVSTGGSVVSTNYSYQLSGATSHGIYSTAGLVDISGGDITLDSNQSCYGIYALGTTSAVNIVIDNASINVGYDASTTRTGTVAATIGVFLASEGSDDSLVSLNNTSISSYEIGVAVQKGTINIDGTGQILTKKASSIAVKDGNVNFSETSSFVLTSFNTTTTASSNQYTLQMPLLSGGTVGTTTYQNTDGIYINGGSFTSEGQLQLSHTGLMNTTPSSGTSINMSTDESLITAQSYAIRVLGGNATVKKATINAVQGGGLRVSGGSAVFGYSGMTNTDISINAQGTRQNTYANRFTDGWAYCLSTNGGDAVYITDTTSDGVTIYGGTFYSANGNGIWIRGNDSTVVKVYGGDFTGRYIDNPSLGNSTNSEWHYGVFSHSGLKITHGGTAIVTGGNFAGANGGLILRGTSNSSMVTAYVTGVLTSGNYSTSFTLTPDIDTGNDGITLFDYSVLYLGKTATLSNGSYVLSSTVQGNGIKVVGEGCALAVNTTGDKGRRRLYVYDGTYTWNGGTISGTTWTSSGAYWEESTTNVTRMFPGTAGKP